MNIKPIRNVDDYYEALAEIESLFDSEPGSLGADKLDVLSTLVEAFEDLNYPIPLPDPVEAIMHSMDALGLTRKDLEPLLGSRARVSEILNRRRPLTLPMMRRLASELEISAEVLIQPYDLVRESVIVPEIPGFVHIESEPAEYVFFASAIGHFSATPDPQAAEHIIDWTDCYLNVRQGSSEAITADETVGQISRYVITAEPSAEDTLIFSRTRAGKLDRCLREFSTDALDEGTSYEEVAI